MEHTEVIKAHGEKLENHEGRIHSLEISDAEQRIQISNLVDSLRSLTNWLRPLVVAMFVALFGFFIWFVQNVAKG